MQAFRLVGSVVDIDGPRLEFTRRYPDRQFIGWFQVAPGMKTYLGDVFRTSPTTTATLEFLVGGRAVLRPRSLFRIVTPKDVTELDFSGPMAPGLLHSAAGYVWEMFDKQDKSFQIQTAGGVLGGREG